ncbi:MAG: glucose-6-phosphate dehydrogenase [Ignavibacteria bacterium]|nr:glucose-6-phosphate dehydrogenase [Ignavibacteria bacterium]
MRKPENQLTVIFGASGDLTKRKLIPDLFDLFVQNLLPDKYAVIGVSRTNYSNEIFRDIMKEGIKSFSRSKNSPDEMIDEFLRKLFYISINTSNPDEYDYLKTEIDKIDKITSNSGNYIFYLSTPPALYGIIPENLGLSGLNTSGNEKSWRRLIIEKPFGYDLKSAQELNHSIKKHFAEEQIYRIDHFLGKETVQNLLVTRFSNGIFEPLWNRNYINHIEITSAESVGIEGRGGYYEGSGALRDMLQNHLLQLAGLVAMEPPANFDPDSIRNETIKVFQSLRPLSDEDIRNNIIRGQYLSSHIKGNKVPGYREETGVSPDSRTETFVAMKFFVDNWRWGGVPFYIRTGKRMPTRVTEIVVHFKATPHKLFMNMSSGCSSCNQLVIRIQPDEGILLKFGMKVPGGGFNVQTVNMEFHYSDLSHEYMPSAYERLLLDCMNADSTLYIRGDAVEACWKFVDPVVAAWKNDNSIKMYGYPAGSWGPETADSLFDIAGITWRYPCKNLADNDLYCEL